MTTILVAGIVHHLKPLGALGEIRRTRWSAATVEAPAVAADLVVLGEASPGADALAAMRALKGPRGAPGVPVLHVPRDPGCTCLADLCLPAAGPRALQDAARLLLLAKARASLPASPAGEAAGETSATLAHDLANLLGVVVGHCRLGARLLEPEHAARRRFDCIEQAAERAGHLLRKIASRDRRQEPPAPVDLNQLVAEVCWLLDRVLGENVSVELRPCAAPARVLGDRDELEHALLNLALNARDAMPRGGRLLIETRTVDLRAHGGAPPLAPGPFVLLSVSDEGQGMDEQTRAHAFDPDFTTRPDAAGHGLGLASVRRVVERAGGAVALDSEPGLGTTFRIWLPRVGPGAHAADAAARVPDAGGPHAQP